MFCGPVATTALPAHRSCMPCLVGLDAVVTSRTMSQTKVARPPSPPSNGTRLRMPSPKSVSQRMVIWRVVKVAPSKALPTCIWKTRWPGVALPALRHDRKK